MLQWLLIAAMTGIAMLAVLWPLSRVRAAALSSHGHDVAVYRDQLSEIERDQARGLVGPIEAAAARAEVGRRLIAAGAAAEAERAAPQAAATRRRRLAALAALLLLPAIALPLYLRLGSPDLPAQPLAARLAAPTARQDLAVLVARIEAHLARNPEDARGFDVLAPVYARMNRPQDAAAAFARAIALAGPTAEREAGRGEALVALAGGVVTAEARAAFEAALALAPDEPRSRFHLARAAEQDGDRAEALRRLTELAAATPQDAPWSGLLRAEIQRLTAPPPREARP